MSRVILYGGTFDPVHCGHLLIAQQVREQLDAARFIWVPSARPPHKDHGRVSGFGHRATMLRLALAGDDGMEVDESEGQRSTPSFTLHTVEHFRDALRADTELNWLIGADSLADLDTWYEVEALVDRCTIITAARPGYDDTRTDHLQRALRPEQIAKLRRGMIDVARIEVSSSDIRNRVRTGRSIRYHVPESVRAYIDDHQLYRV